MGHLTKEGLSRGTHFAIHPMGWFKGTSKVKYLDTTTVESASVYQSTERRERSALE